MSEKTENYQRRNKCPKRLKTIKEAHQYPKDYKITLIKMKRLIKLSSNALRRA